jgi:hypothetical protein
LDRGEIASANRSCFELFGDRDNGNGKVAAVEQTEEGEEAYCEIGYVFLGIRPVLKEKSSIYGILIARVGWRTH